MKSVGIVRRVDDLGRIVLPKELRETFKIARNDPMEIYVEGNDTIIFKKYEAGCTFCGEVNDIVTHMGKKVCKNCIAELQK